MIASRIRTFVAIVMTVGSGCRGHSAVKLSSGQIDDLHRFCHNTMESSRHELRRSSRLGFLPETGPKGTPVAIYGAPWCDACHVAADYMKQYRIPFVELDIEKDEEAKAKSESLVSRAGLGEVRTLPVIDVRGTIILGFDPCALEVAWAAP